MSELLRGLAAFADWRRLALAAVLGGFSALAMPPAGLFPVLLVSLPGLVVLLDRAPTSRSGFWTGWWYGFGFHLIGLYWISFALFTDIGQFWWALPFSAAGLPLLMAVYTGAVGWSYRALAPRGAGRILVFAALWSGAEWLRGHLFTGFPWNLYGYTWGDGGLFDTLAVLQSTSVIGIYGLTALTVAVACVPALWGDDTVSGRQRKIAAALAVSFSLAVVGWGSWRLAADDGSVEPGVRLRLIQPNIPQTMKWASAQRRDNFLNQLELTATPAERAPTLVVWAETATPFFLDREPVARSLIAKAMPHGAVALIGTPRLAAAGTAESPPRYFNGMLALDDAGNILESYDKAHLVPFGEYMPLRQWLPVGAIAGDGGEYAPGPGPRTLRLPGMPAFSPLICYEAIFPAAVSDPQDRPAWLVNLTNDAWYGLSAGPHQHLAIAAVRAVEEGLPLVRVANTGISAVVDSYGRIIAQAPLGTRAALDSDLPHMQENRTLYATWGDLTLLMVVGIFLVCEVFIRSRSNC